MKCEKCGERIVKAAEYCGECGAPMSGKSKTKAVKKAGAKKVARKAMTRASTRHGAHAQAR